MAWIQFNTVKRRIANALNMGPEPTAEEWAVVNRIVQRANAAADRAIHEDIFQLTDRR